MQLRTIFRGLVAGQWLIALLGTPAIYAQFFTADAVREAPPPQTWWWLLSLFGLTLSAAAVVASIGLWRFRPWGRSLFVALEVVTLGIALLSPLFNWPTSASTTRMSTTPLDWLIGPMTGAIIALAYASPIASEFCRERPARGGADNFGLDATSG